MCWISDFNRYDLLHYLCRMDYPQTSDKLNKLNKLNLSLSLSDIWHTLVGNEIIDNSDVVGA